MTEIAPNESHVPMRRLAELPLSCGGRLTSTQLQTTLLDAELNFPLFDLNAKVSLWESRPLVGNVRTGAIRLHCPALGTTVCARCATELGKLRELYSGSQPLHLEQVVRAIRVHNGRRPFAPPPPATAAAEVALLVLADYENLFHQFGSVAIAWAALQESFSALPHPSSRETDPARSVAIFMLNNANLAPTQLFWSPGLSRWPPAFVRDARSPPPPATYPRIVLAQPATESWWWNVWRRDAADRRGVLTPLAARLVAALLPRDSAEAREAEASATAALGVPGASSSSSSSSSSDGGGSGSSSSSAASARFALLLRRAGPAADRRILNEKELAAGLSSVLAGHGLRLAAIELVALSTRAQLALIRTHAALLIGTHGAGLLWNLFLPPGAPVVELLNVANANEYYANHARWTGRPYASWQNANLGAEEPAIDPLTKQPLAPFRNHMRVNVSAVVAVVGDVLRNPRVPA